MALEELVLLKHCAKLRLFAFVYVVLLRKRNYARLKGVAFENQQLLHALLLAQVDVDLSECLRGRGG